MSRFFIFLLFPICALANTKSIDPVKIHKVAVINSLSDTLNFHNIGLTAFGNSSNSLDIADLHYSNYLCELVTQSIKNIYPNIEFENFNPEKASDSEEFAKKVKGLKMSQLIALVNQRYAALGYDAILSVKPAGIMGASGNYLVVPAKGGFVFLSSSIGKNNIYTQIIPSYSISFHPVLEKEKIYTVNSSDVFSINKSSLGVKKPEDYSKEEKDAILSELKLNIEQTVDPVVKELFSLK